MLYSRKTSLPKKGTKKMCLSRIIGIFKKKRPLPHRSLHDIKNACRILFIDDHKFGLVDRLKTQEGWKNTTWIKDLDSISQTELLDAHIVLVDVQGVGKKMKFEDEGLGLIVAIKENYPLKKVIMYSAENQGQIDSFHKASNVVDYRLRKNSTQYEFNVAIETLANEAFSLENCIARLKQTLYNEYSLKLTDEQIEEKLMKVDAEHLDERSIASVFNLQNAAAVAQIIQLFYTLGMPK